MKKLLALALSLSLLGTFAPALVRAADADNAGKKRPKLTEEQRKLRKELLEKYDANKDGKLDFVTIDNNSPGNVYLALGDGTGGFNSGGTLATVDMLASLWNYLAGTILPEAAGLAVVGAVINYSRKKPFMPLVFPALAFLSVTGLWKLVQAMVG